MRIALGVVLLLAACGDGSTFSDAGPPDAARPDAGCPALWTVDAVQTGATATVTGGHLELAASDMAQGAAIEVTQGGLTGDFDVSFVVSDFTAGGSGAYLQAGLQDTDTTTAQFLIAAIGTIPQIGVSAADLPAGSTDIQASALTAATLRFQRSGSAVVVTASTADATATIDATYAGSPMTVGVELGSNNGTVTPATTAQIDAFTVTGAGATADPFDCDSLIP